MKAKWLIGLVLVFASLGRIEADVTIPSSASVGPPPVGLGTGLLGSFYDVEDDSAHWVDTNARAEQVMLNYAPSSLFVSTILSYDDDPALGDATPLSSFLGHDSASLTGTNPALGNCVLHMAGFLKVTADMDADTGDGGSDIDIIFALNSDDGSFLKIAGLLIANYPGTHQAVEPHFGIASFESEGLYPLEVTYYNYWCYDWSGGAMIDWYSSIPGGPSYGMSGPAPQGTSGIVPNEVLYTTPEPATLSLLALGGLVIMRWRRK